MTPVSVSGSLIAVCLKWVDQRVDAEAVLASAPPDERFAGVSMADQAALEWALRQRERCGGEVVAITVGPVAAEAVLRDALAAGADRAARVDLPFGMPSRLVATALGRVAADAQTVWCGDSSFDRGTGSVPAFLAHELGVAQALGLVAIDLPAIDPPTTHPATTDPPTSDPPTPGPETSYSPTSDSAGVSIGALRRLDGGRRERLSISGRAVLSVEGSTALLRRAPLRGLLDKPSIEIVSFPPPVMPPPEPDARPYRPRPRTFAPPTGTSALERIKALTTTAAAAHGETVALDPPAAAERILAALEEWGYYIPER